MSLRLSRLALILLCPAVLLCGPAGCGKSPPKSAAGAVSVKVEKHADGLTYGPGQSAPYTGEVVHFSTSGGRLLRESWKDGLPDGIWRRWAADGSLRKEQTFEQGKQTHQRQWHPNGKLKEDTQMRDGVAFGEVRLWWPDGRLRRSCIMEAGEAIHGHILQYDQDGTVLYDAIYNHGTWLSGKIPGEKLAANALKAAE